VNSDHRDLSRLAAHHGGGNGRQPVQNQPNLWRTLEAPETREHSRRGETREMWKSPDSRPRGGLGMFYVEHS
jgi:hypothetical protein